MSSNVPGSIAAVDLGSNSFHLIVANTVNGHFKVVDRMREMVRLAAGLDEHNRIMPAALTRAMACLERFGERVRDLPPGSVRVVGTNTLRKAREAAPFLARAEQTLGHPVDIISGTEEARLIYLGVSHGLEDDSHTRLVMDIGGGSTEFILGRRFEPILVESLHMGCVSMSSRYFADGRIIEKRLRAAEIAARQELEAMAETFRRTGWQSVIGASGTNLAIRDVVIAQGWSKDGITRESLQMLRRALLDAGHIDKISLDGLSGERRAVFPGGVAVLLGAFEELGIEHARVSDQALREGLLYDLLGRIRREDVREQTIDDLALRYHVDRAQGARVADTALGLHAQQAANGWLPERAEDRRLLRWAATLHEIGHAISHSQHQKHGGYLLRNLDMAGFARGDQKQLALLVRGHRRKVPLEEFGELHEATATRLFRLCIILRLATLLHRRRSSARVPALEFSVDERKLRLELPEHWLDAHPLTRADLAQEAGYLKAAGFKLKFK